MKNNIITACGGHARPIIEIIESTGKWNICGLVGLENTLGKKILGYSAIGVEKDLISIRDVYRVCFNAIAQIKDIKKELKNLIC